MNQTSQRLPPNVRHKHGAFYFVTPQRKWVRLGTVWADSEIALHKIAVDAPVEGTMAALIARYMAEVAPLKAKKTYEGNIDEAKNLMKVFAKMKPEDVDGADVGQYLVERGKFAPVRANREKALLSHMFTKAILWKIVKSNPCRGVARNPEYARDRYVDNGDYDQVFGISNQIVKDVMTMAVCTAQRIGDLLEIRMADISEDGIIFSQNKLEKRIIKGETVIVIKRTKLMVRISAAMQEIIDRRSPTAVEFLFEHSKNRGGKADQRKNPGLVPYTYDGFSAMYKRTVKKALKSGLIVEPYTFHDLRAKALTDAKRAGRTDVQQLGGHKNAKQTDDYIKRRELVIVEPTR